jgi:hypothetical protein
MDHAPSLHDIPNQTKDKPAPAGTPFDYKEIAREVLPRGAPMDRAPSLQNIPNQTRDKPAPVGTAFDYKEMAREVLARIDQRLADLGADANTPPDESEEEPDGSEPEFQSKTASSLMSSDDQAALVRWAWRGLIGLLLSASLVAAISFLWSHSDTTGQSVAEVVPRSDPGSTTLADKPEPGSPAAARAMADVAPAPAAPPPRTMPDYDKPNPAPVPPELTELMRKVDRNIAGLAQAVTDLRLAHQQATGDNAKTAEDIKASLDQMARSMAMAMAPDARASDQVTQARPPTQVTQARSATQVLQATPPAQVTPAKPPAQVTPAKPPAQVAQAKPPAPAPQPAARRNRRYVPPYLSPSDALGFMR